MKDGTLPRGWIWTNLGQLKSFSLYGPRFSSDDYSPDGVCVVRTSDISDSGKVDLSRAPRLRLSDYELARYRLQPGDLLVTRTGSLGTVALFNDDIAAIPGAYLIQYRLALPLTTSQYLLYFLRSATAQEGLRGGGAGVGRPNLNAPTIEAIAVPLPPLAEQRRIVVEIEKQFSRLDASVFSLHQAQRKLAVCYRAVLQAAIQGRLTSATETSREWPWVPLGDLADASTNAVTDGPFGSNLKTEHYTDDGPRVVRLQNIGEGKFIDQLACISEAHFERLQKHAVEPGDLLIAALGSELPRACVAPDNLGPAIVKADCIRFRPAAARVSTRYLCYALNSHVVRQATRRLVHGVGRPRLNLSDVKSILIPLPPMNDQMEIVEAIEDNLSLIDSVEGTVQTILQRANRLRQSILKRAFEGEFVPQYPTDESAFALLSRIREERPLETMPAVGKPTRKKRNAISV